MIAYVGRDCPFQGQGTRDTDADGRVLLPGLTDGHTHVPSDRYGVKEFIRHVIPCGISTAVTEALEFNVIVGEDGRITC